MSKGIEYKIEKLVEDEIREAYSENETRIKFWLISEGWAAPEERDYMLQALEAIHEFYFKEPNRCSPHIRDLAYEALKVGMRLSTNKKGETE